MEPLGSTSEADLNYVESYNSTELLCGICGENHSCRECGILKLTNQILDKPVPSKAKLSLPDSFEIRKLCDDTYNVYAKCVLEKGTEFGPFQAKKLFTLHPSIDFPLKIFTNGTDEDLSEYYLDTSDENECNWMMFVSPASDIKEQNVICYQESDQLYYRTIKDVSAGEALKVWYSPHYAVKMKKTLLKTSRCDRSEQDKAVDIEGMLRKKKNIMPRESWSCKFCGKVEKELSVFAVHLLEHYKSQAKKVCAICKDSFLSRSLLKKHLKIVHGSNLNQTTDTIKKTEASLIKMKEHCSKDSSVGGPLLLNNISADSLDNSILLLPQTDLLRLDLTGIENQNMMMETENLNLDNLINDNVKQLDYFNFELNEPENEQLICDICLKGFLKLKSLIQHLEQHTGKFLCQSCNSVFARKENLKHHSCNIVYKIKCPLCEKIFVQQKYLTLHIKGFHNKEFTCERCNNFYESKQNLDTHSCSKVPAHKREKFPCSVCSKMFFNKKNLYEHVARHNNTQKFVCEVCNAKLSSRKSYLAHVKLHEGSLYPCDECSKAFTRRDVLKVHKNSVHSGNVEPSTCHICKKTLKSKKLLKSHMETHNDLKPHTCHICQASFKQRMNLKRHLNRHEDAWSNLDAFFKDDLLIYHCPKCNKNMKLKSSLVRHMRSLHPNYEISGAVTKQHVGKLIREKTEDKMSEEYESAIDLKETIDKMNFNTDEVNCTENNEINIEIDKFLNNTSHIDNFLSDSNDQMVEDLIENQVDQSVRDYISKEVCLSMPDLTADQEIKLGQNAYMLEDGTIVEPQESSSKVVVYILDQEKFS